MHIEYATAMEALGVPRHQQSFVLGEIASGQGMAWAEDDPVDDYLLDLLEDCDFAEGEVEDILRESEI